MSESHLNFASLWSLDPAVAYLNHGSFGACPTAVLAAQMALRQEMEREPVDFLSETLPARLHKARVPLAAFLGADPADLVFVANATTGVNAVLRSLLLTPEDELLLTNHTYAACRKTVEFVAARTGARVVVAQVPFPCGDDEELIDSVLKHLSPKTRLALLDHVTSTTALILPVARLIDALRARGVETLVDGAHAPGMVPLALAQLGAAYYTGNAHKWLCAPKGAGFLYVRRDCQDHLHANITSHGYLGGMHAEFDWPGTFDPTAWLCVPESVRFLGRLMPGGWPQVMKANRDLTLRARALLLDAARVEAPCPETMIGSMASIPLPRARLGSPANEADCKSLHDWFRARNVETCIFSDPTPMLRISAQLYNNLDQFTLLARLLEEALHGG